MKRIIEIIKNNYIFILLLIPLIFTVSRIRVLDNDTWWLLNTGKYIWNNGLFHVDPFTIHEGLHVVVQQWLFTFILWGIYHNLGKTFLFLTMFIYTIIIIIFYYKLCLLVSKNRNISVILTILFLLLFNYFLTMRPQIITYLCLIIELYTLEKYVQDNNYKKLYILPLISLILINMHASMWIMQFLIIGPFIINTMIPKKYRIDTYNLKPLIFITIIMFLVGFINPYGYESVFYLYYSYGYKLINTNIQEMFLPTFDVIQVKINILIILIFLFFNNYVKKFKLDIRHYILISGLLLLAFMHYKGIIYFYIVSFYIFAYCLREVKIKLNIKKIHNKYFSFINIIMKEVIACFIIFVSIFSFIYTIRTINYENDYKETFDYLLKNYSNENIILYSNFVNGGYAEYRGVKTYIDPRAEVFLKKMNRKNDILDEYYNLNKENIDTFINKYNFTHLLVDSNEEIILEYLNSTNKYKIIFVEYNKNTNKVIGYLYENNSIN